MSSNKVYLIYGLFFLIFISCQNPANNHGLTNLEKPFQATSVSEPNYAYTVILPIGWAAYDTVMSDGLKVRLIFPPESLEEDAPLGNILIASMGGRGIDDFTTANIKYLETAKAGTKILEKDYMELSEYKCQWFTYSKIDDGIVRDMINYIIPVKGFAYMVTFGSNEGRIPKYRAVFDEIVKSFKG